MRSQLSIYLELIEGAFFFGGSGHRPSPKLSGPRSRDQRVPGQYIQAAKYPTQLHLSFFVS